MTNKRYFIITLLILIFGCNSDNDVPQNETANGAVIRFGGKITNIVSKAITEGNDFSDNATIGIFGWGHTIGNTTNQTLRKDLNNSQYTKTAGNSEFSSETHAHYSINPDTLLDFYAYYPYTITASPLNIPFDLKKQDDIMWATPVKNRDKTSADEPVNFSFNHILSAITLKFKKADDIKEEMILQSISMEKLSVNYTAKPTNRRVNVQPLQHSHTHSSTTKIKK